MKDTSDNSIRIDAIKLRLISVKESIQRTRFVFIIMTVASSAILFTIWNDRLSRDRALAFDSPATTQRDSQSPEPLSIYGRKQIVAEWYANRFTQVGLLGVRLSVADLQILGSFTLVVITIWFYYSNRNENRALVSLLKDVHEELEDREMEISFIMASKIISYLSGSKKVMTR